MPALPSGRRSCGGATAAAGALALTLFAVPAAAAPPATTGPGEDTAPRWATATAAVETPPAFDDEAGGDADADDPALWISPTDGDRSLVLGTLKNGGLAAYGLDGRLLQHVAAPPAPAGASEAGRFNNVDVVQGARIGGRTLDLAVVSDRGRDRIRVYAIDPRGAAAGAAVLTDVTDPGAAPVFSASEAQVDEQATAYGLAAGLGADGGVQVLTTRRHSTDLAVLRLVAGPGGTIGYRQQDRIALPSAFELPDGTSWSPCEEPGEGPQAEGSTFDPATGAWYVAQEDVGIWRLVPGDGGTWTRTLVDRVRDYGVPAAWDEASESCVVTGTDPGEGGTRLTADAEGLTVAHAPDGTGYLLASSQGDSTFAVYELGSGRYAAGFAIADGPGSGGGAVDGVQHSDGATVTTRAVGSAYPYGLLVLHDGEDTGEAAADAGRTATGFKLVPLERVVRPLVLDAR
ncbi:phytase [Kineococcus glutinatus]|uniref:Phytase n=1 Tax=Kineococcus glutinatus TaxID=1070872 RepID=A0ABP8VDW1_9ACTN